MKNRISRAKAISILGSGFGLAAHQVISSSGLPLQVSTHQKTEQTMAKRVIPSTGELLPVVGAGSWLQFDVGPATSERQPLIDVLQTLKNQGGSVIDSSPMYGRAEAVIGDITSEISGGDAFFYATKVWTQGKDRGIRQMQASMEKLKRKKLDLIQIHNLVDWQTHLKTLEDWKVKGLVRYVGITHYDVSAHKTLEDIIKSNEIDFVQFNYSVRVRNAEKSLLKTARDRGVAVIVNEPYESGKLFGIVRDKTIPSWAKEYQINSWGQFFLKFILSHPAVTCVIPGTSNPKHMLDNTGAGYGPLPDEATRKKMADLIDLY
jgi:diketogulonate reductase-like aldo/keto reductase